MGRKSKARRRNKKNKVKTIEVAPAQTSMLDYKEDVVEKFRYFYVSSFFNTVSVTDYLNIENILASNDERWGTTYSHYAKRFFNCIPDLEGVTDKGILQLWFCATFPLFCYHLAIHPVNELPDSSDPAFNEFLSVVKHFHDFYHRMGLPNKEEEALLAVSIYLSTVTENAADQEIVFRSKNRIYYLINWYCNKYRPLYLGKKLMIYAWTLEHLTWKAKYFIWEQKQKNNLEVLTVLCLFNSPRTLNQLRAIQKAKE